MYDSPNTLQEYCLDFICENMSCVCDATNNTLEDEETSASNKDLGLVHSSLAEKLIERLSEKKKLEDENLRLLDGTIANLKRLTLYNASKLTLDGLRRLKNHNFVELEVRDLHAVNVSEVFNFCLSDWTIQNLRSLNISSSLLCPAVNTGLALRKNLLNLPFQLFKCLKSLNVSKTEFNQHCLEIITCELPLLENLDISSTKVIDITPLKKCKDNLKSLKMYNLQNGSREEMVNVILELTSLRHLDISDDCAESYFSVLYPMRYRIGNLLRSPHALPHLISLDLSGKENIDMCQLLEFMQEHPSLKFLGLVHTHICECTIIIQQQDITITGHGSEEQIIKTLKIYNDRPIFIQKSLCYLFQLAQAYTIPRVDVIQLILPNMEAFPKHLTIQMAATACLYNLSKGELGQKIHPKWLRKIVELTMNAMENFPTHMQLQKNTLLTLCNDRILQEVTFDKYRCAKLVMDCLCAFEDASMNRMCVAICSILAAKISTIETSKLGAQHDYMKKLLGIVKLKVSENIVDITLKFTLSALWNLTDESPGTCSVFLEKKGLNLFLEVLEKFQNDTAVETKVLGLLNNIAEVRELRSHLMLDDLIVNLMRLLKSIHLDVSYFAAGIVAHLASDGIETWTVKCHERSIILAQLKEVVLNWKTPDGEMVAYRSFTPFFPLLNSKNVSEVQLWAVWAMQHVCNRNYSRYCPMLLEEGGKELLLNLVLNAHTCECVKTICQNILNILKEKGPFFVSKEDYQDKTTCIN